MAHNRSSFAGRGALAALCMPLSLAAQPQTILTVDEADPDRPIAADVGSGISASVGTSAIGDNLVAIVLRENAGGDVVAALMLGDAGDLLLRLRTDSGWGATLTVADGVGAFDAAYERRSGDLLIAYAKGASSLVFNRVLSGGSLSPESSSNFGLSAAPSRIVVAMDDGTDAGVIAASRGSDLAAAYWDGAALSGATDLDASYAGGAWDAAWPAGPGEPMVAWVRTGDASPRFSRYSGGAWTVQALGPPMSGVIQAIDLAADCAGRTPGLLGAFLTGAGGGGLEVAEWDGSAWGLPATLSTDVADASRPFAIAFEGTGGGATCAWIEDGSQRVTVCRWDGSTWGPQADSAPIGELDEVMAASHEGQAGVIVGAVVRDQTAGAPYAQYVALSSGGNVDLGGVTVNGDTGEGAVALPPAPSVSSGSPDLDYGNDKTVTLAPGTRGKLEAGNGFRLNMTAGDYVFESFDSGNNTTFVGDTTAGNVRFILSNGNFDAGNGFALTTVGPGMIELIVANGNWEVGNNATIEAMIVVHNGNLEFGNNAGITGHLYAAGNIEGGSGTLTTPGTWIPGGAGPVTRDGHALIVSSGTPGPVTELTTGWIAGPLPLSISSPVSPASPTILRWSEVDPR